MHTAATTFESYLKQNVVRHILFLGKKTSKFNKIISNAYQLSAAVYNRSLHLTYFHIKVSLMIKETVKNRSNILKMRVLATSFTVILTRSFFTNLLVAK